MSSQSKLEFGRSEKLSGEREEKCCQTCVAQRTCQDEGKLTFCKGPAPAKTFQFRSLPATS